MCCVPESILAHCGAALKTAAIVIFIPATGVALCSQSQLYVSRQLLEH